MYANRNTMYIWLCLTFCAHDSDALKCYAKCLCALLTFYKYIHQIIAFQQECQTFTF